MADVSQCTTDTTCAATDAAAGAHGDVRGVGDGNDEDAPDRPGGNDNAAIVKHMCARCAPRVGELTHSNDQIDELPNPWLCLVCRCKLTTVVRRPRRMLSRPFKAVVAILERLKSVALALHPAASPAKLVGNGVIKMPKYSSANQQYYRVVVRWRYSFGYITTNELISYNAYTDQVYVGNSSVPLAKYDDPSIDDKLKEWAIETSCGLKARKRSATAGSKSGPRSGPRNRRDVWYPLTSDRYLELEDDCIQNGECPPSGMAVSYDKMAEVAEKIAAIKNSSEAKYPHISSHNWKVDFPPGRIQGKRYINITNSSGGHNKYYVHVRIDAITGDMYSQSGTKPFDNVLTYH